jgi:hypothetical protein
MEVPVTIDEGEIEDDHGGLRPGIIAECTRCGHTTQSFGTSERSVGRCLALMREQCPEDEKNYYVEEK